MKVCAFQLKPHFLSRKKPALPIHPTKLPTNPPSLKPKPPTKPPTPSSIKTSPYKPTFPNLDRDELPEASIDIGLPRWVLLGGTSLGLALLLMGVDGGQHEALAFGPERPLVEEFWDNMRRYGLYVLTVSTGAIYTIFQPIFELLKNPITAILIITVIVGSAYLVSQVLSLMVGISDFSYNYSY